VNAHGRDEGPVSSPAARTGPHDVRRLLKRSLLYGTADLRM